MKKENIVYLTVEQVMADYNELAVQHRERNGNRPVILFGGSYGGMLAVWLRMKFP